jgi:hypothetical protein
VQVEMGTGSRRWEVEVQGGVRRRVGESGKGSGNANGKGSEGGVGKTVVGEIGM